MPAARVLVLSATASAINIIKSLRGEPDIELFVSDANRFASGLYEPGVTPLILPRARDGAAYRAALDHIIAACSIDILLPTSDHDMAAVVRLLSGGWDPPVRMFRPSPDAHRLLADKLALAERLWRRGIPAPRTWSGVAAAHYPAVVKPLREGGGKGVVVVRDRAEAEAAVRRAVTQYGPDCLVQEYIPGGIGATLMALLLYDPSGRIRCSTVMQSSLTYYTWGAGGNAGRIIDDPELRELAEAAIAACGGWRGPVCVEFRRHAGTGRPYIIEVNCRLNGYSYLTTMNGLNYPQAMLALLRGEEPPAMSLPQQSLRRNFVLGFREKVVEQWVR